MNKVEEKVETQTCPYCATCSPSGDECPACHAYPMAPLVEDDRNNLWYADYSGYATNAEITTGWKQGSQPLVTLDSIATMQVEETITQRVIWKLEGAVADAKSELAQIRNARMDAQDLYNKLNGIEEIPF